MGLAAHAGCGKKDEAPQHTQKPKTDKPVKVVKPKDGVKPAPSLTAEELHKKALRSTDPAKTFAGQRFVVSGKVHSVKRARTYSILVKAGPARQQLSAVFRDHGDAAQDKKLAKDGDVKMDCRIRGRLAMRIELDDCVLK